MFSLKTNPIHRVKMIVVMIALFVLSMPVFAPMHGGSGVEVAFNKGENFKSAETSGQSAEASSDDEDESEAPEADDNFGYIWGGA